MSRKSTAKIRVKSKGSANRAIVRSRVPLLQFGFGVLFAAAVVSQARVQVFQRDAVLKAGIDSKRFIVSRQFVPERGRILSIDGKPLAQERSTRLLSVDFRRVPKSRGFYMDLSAATGIAATEFAQFADSKKTLDWPRDFSPEQLAKINKVKQTWRADGLGYQNGGARSYPLGEAAAGVVGYMRDGAPKGGLELMQNQLLVGEKGEIKGMVDRQGQFLPTRIEGEKPKEDGQSLTLTIDADLQRKAYEAVRDSVIANKADQGVAIVMRPGGDVLAMTSYPTFDPNKPLPPVKKGERSADFTPTYQAALEPGSTFKILTLAKALDQGILGSEQHTNCGGQLQVGSKFVRCDAHGGKRAHGSISPEDAIARSCNVSAAKWALEVGYEDFVPFVQDLGLLKRPAMGLPNEAAGLFSYGEYAKRLQLANIGFGQSINVPPVALCSAFCALANEGKAVSPRLIAKIGEKNSTVPAGRQVIKPETARTVLKFMKSVIASDHGTGRSLRIPGYEMGGKTGTAQKRNAKTGKMEGGGYVANFVGFVPAEQPQAVILVMIDNPKAGRIYGADVAGPVFMEVARGTIQELGIKPSAPKEVAPAAKPKTVAKIEKPRFAPPRVSVVAAIAPTYNEAPTESVKALVKPGEKPKATNEAEKPKASDKPKATDKPVSDKPKVAERTKPTEKPKVEERAKASAKKPVEKPKTKEVKRTVVASKPVEKKKSTVTRKVSEPKKTVAKKETTRSSISPARRREAAALARRTTAKRSNRSSSPN